MKGSFVRLPLDGMKPKKILLFTASSPTLLLSVNRGDRYFCYRRYIGKVAQKIIYYQQIIRTGSKYPQNIILIFEKQNHWRRPQLSCEEWPPALNDLQIVAIATGFVLNLMTKWHGLAPTPVPWTPLTATCLCAKHISEHKGSSSASFLAEISIRSPRNFFICII